jgi:hypothetical protein
MALILGRTGGPRRTVGVGARHPSPAPVYLSGQPPLLPREEIRRTISLGELDEE